ncbi:hypothetical protein BN1723_020820, partial [Verticillium longisporum]
MSGLINKIKDA